MTNYLLTLGLCISLVCPSITYASPSKTFKEVPKILFSPPIKSIEASSLSELDEQDLEDRISRLPLPDNITPDILNKPYQNKKQGPLFPKTNIKREYKK